MKITIRGCEPIIISDELLQAEAGQFGADTPYVAKVVTRINNRSYREGKLPLKLMCLRALRDRARTLGTIRTYGEPLAGIGLAARLFNAPEMWLNDLDEGCRDVLVDNFAASISDKDADVLHPGPTDLIFADFNNFTLAKYRKEGSPALDNTFKAATKFVILNDCSVYHFRYGVKAYQNYSKLLGTKVTSFKTYAQAAAKGWKKTYPEWTLVHTAAFRDSSFHLFYKGDAPFEYVFFDKPEPLVSLGRGFLS